VRSTPSAGRILRNCFIYFVGCSPKLLADEPHLAFNFNLCSTAFITYLFAPVDHMTFSVALPRAFIERYKTLLKNVPVRPFLNDFEALARYNRDVLYQCHRQVYSSAIKVHGVKTV
jgi:hypothetical protein